MFDCDGVCDFVYSSLDPRMSMDYVKCISGGGSVDGSVLLLGVLHDHPSSVYRVSQVLEFVDPGVVALELPPVAVPMFRLYSCGGRPPSMGGEMSAAIQVTDSRYVGIDAPNLRYLAALARRLVETRRESYSRWSVLKQTVKGVAHAAVFPSGYLLGRFGLEIRTYRTTDYGVSFGDSAEMQAEDELSQIRRREGFVSAIETPPHVEMMDRVREETMAGYIDDLRREFDVAAVVGMEHLEPLYRYLTGGFN